MIKEDVWVVFENCETAFLPKNSISVLHLGDIVQNITYSEQGVQIMQVAKTLCLSVENPHQSFVNRCKKWKDITQIRVGENLYMIYWPDSCECENINQENWYYDNSILIRVEPKGEDYYE